jgi:hypothetical protein
MLTDDLCELHLSPEVEEVQEDPEDDDDTESHHVLRRPLDPLRLVDDIIAVVTASLAILKRQDEGIDDVDDEEDCQPHRSDQGIPVSSEELTHGVVGFFREERHKVHRHVEGQEQDKREA